MIEARRGGSTLAIVNVDEGENKKLMPYYGGGNHDGRWCMQPVNWSDTNPLSGI
jgi:hypothetical protein